jgi:DNA-binding MarR family transcriptional regulator
MPDPQDRRSRLAVLTAAGRKACKEGMRVQDQTERELFGALTREEAQQLSALMGKVEPRSK